jgi:hypothetical protein
MVVKDGIAYLQAGGGIVFDSDPYDEWVETINKLGMFVSSSKIAAEETRLTRSVQARTCSASRRPRRSTSQSRKTGRCRHQSSQHPQHQVRVARTSTLRLDSDLRHSHFVSGHGGACDWYKLDRSLGTGTLAVIISQSKAKGPMVQIAEKQRPGMAGWGISTSP